MNHQRWQDGRPSGLCQARLAQQFQQCYTLFRAVGIKGVTKVIHTNTYQFWYPLVPHEELNASTIAFLCKVIYKSTGSSESSAPKGKTFFPQELQPVTFSGKFCRPFQSLLCKYIIVSQYIISSVFMTVESSELICSFSPLFRT